MILFKQTNKQTNKQTKKNTKQTQKTNKTNYLPIYPAIIVAGGLLIVLNSE